MKAYSGREIIKLLRAHGWEVVRVEGSHHILTKPGRDETISVPVHGSRNLKSGIVHYILKAAGIRSE